MREKIKPKWQTKLENKIDTRHRGRITRYTSANHSKQIKNAKYYMQ